MARPFAVQHLVFCESVEYLDPARPHRDSFLNRVDYTLTAPTGTEFPFEPPEFWLFARFYWLHDRPGATPPLVVSCVWLDSPTGREIEIWQRPLGRVQFYYSGQVSDRAWGFRNVSDSTPYQFPGTGRYEFQLWHPVRRLGARRIKRREYIRVEV
jgi:hypothetical protein